MKNSISYSPQELLEWVDETCSSGLVLDLVFHSLAVGNPVKAFFAGDTNIEYWPLFFKTELSHMFRASPYLCRIPSGGHAFLNSFAINSSPWGFLAFGLPDFKPAVRHWQSLFQARMADGAVTHLRFYDGHVMPRLLASSTAEERAALMGPYASMVVFTDSQWTVFNNPALEKHGGPENTATSYRAAASPWWQMRKHHNAAFTDIFKKVFRVNLQNHFWENAEPRQIMAREEEHESLAAFVDEAVDLAEAKGIAETGQQTGFVSLCLEHGLEKVRAVAANEQLSGLELVEKIKAKLGLEAA